MVSRPTGGGALRRALLVGVSAAAIFLMVEAEQPRAQDGERAQYWISAIGQYDWWDRGDPDAFPLPLPPDFTLGDGYGVGGEIGVHLDDLHTLVARVRYNDMSQVSDTATRTGYKYSGVSEGSHDEHALIGDLEIGRDVGLGLLGAAESSVRLHAGIRIAHFEAGTDVSFANSFLFILRSGQLDIDREFIGGGPRAGFDATLVLNDWASLDVASAAALLFGRHSFDLSGAATSSFGSPPVFDDHRSDFVIVPNVDASAALTFYLGDRISLSLGYMVDAFFNVHDDGSESHHAGNRVVHGPFGLITIRFPPGGRSLVQ